MFKMTSTVVTSKTKSSGYACMRPKVRLGGITRSLNMAYQEGGIISTSFPRPPLCAEMRLLPREQAKILLHQVRVSKNIDE